MFAPPGNVENVGKDSRASSRNSLLHQEMLKMLPKLFAPPGNVENVGKDLRAASRNSLLHREMLKMLVRIHKLQAETLCSTRKWFTSCKPKLFAPPGSVENVGNVDMKFGAVLHMNQSPEMLGVVMHAMFKDIFPCHHNTLDFLIVLWGSFAAIPQTERGKVFQNNSHSVLDL
ncbi:hypothetical protein V6N11_064950 [Hibiscus sabdariffa]|uniref:Uncharacterized protein n=1 Tax=Hibiscus sabdariffa TaxID=183260 RepID=A0ABR2SIF9_9ROSI